MGCHQAPVSRMGSAIKTHLKPVCFTLSLLLQLKSRPLMSLNMSHVLIHYTLNPYHSLIHKSYHITLWVHVALRVKFKFLSMAGVFCRHPWLHPPLSSSLFPTVLASGPGALPRFLLSSGLYGCCSFCLAFMQDSCNCCLTTLPISLINCKFLVARFLLDFPIAVIHYYGKLHTTHVLDLYPGPFSLKSPLAPQDG